MRLFTGLDLPPDLLARIEEVLAGLKPLAPVRWSPVENLHITTKFIGEWPPSRLDELIHQLRFPYAPVAITVAGLGFFPRIFWAGIQGTPELRGLARATEAALEPIGIAKEPRPYSPHLTLARIASPRDLGALRTRLSQDRFGTFEAREFHLYQSRNSLYTKLATFPLQ